jgi:uncharacterized iron-regulated membrane protein
MIFWMHLVTGCLAGIVVLIMAVTGVLLAYQRQITGWMDRGLRSELQAAGPGRLPIEEMLAKISAQNRAIPSAITVRAAPSAPAEVSFGREHVWLVDVHTGGVLGESAPGTRAFFQRVENWHRWLGAGSDNRAIGRAVTGASNFGFFLLVVSGPFLWLPRGPALFRGGISGRARDFNWHNVIGIWCAVPLLLVGLSGMVMSYQWANNLLYRLTGNVPPVSNSGTRPVSDSRQDSSLAGLNLAWVRAEQQVPGWQSVTLRMPSSSHAPLTFAIDAGNGGRPDKRSQLTLDRGTARVVRWEDFSSYNAGRRLRSWLRFFHTGEAGGVAGQTAAGIASAGAAMLVWTGLCLACRRLTRWKICDRSMQAPLKGFYFAPPREAHSPRFRS